MSFMEDLGRSNALGSVNSLMGKAIEMRRDEDRQAERAYDLSLKTQELGMTKETHDIDMRQKKIAIGEAEKEQKRLDSPYDITTDPRYLALPPEGQKAVLTHAVKNKYTDQNGIGTVRSAKQLLSDTAGQPELFKSSMGPLVEARKNETLQAYQALNEAKATGDEKKIATAAGLYKTSLARYNAANGTYLGHANKLDLDSEKNEREDKKLAATIQYRKDFLALKKLNQTTGGDKKTAFIKNVAFLTDRGWDKDEAIKLFSEGKPMSRETFIARMNLNVANNDMITPEDKFEAVQQGIDIYDTVIAKKPTAGKVMTVDIAREYLKKAGGDPKSPETQKKAKELAQKDGYKF